MLMIIVSATTTTTTTTTTITINYYTMSLQGMENSISIHSGKLTTVSVLSSCRRPIVVVNAADSRQLVSYSNVSLVLQ